MLQHKRDGKLERISRPSTFAYYKAVVSSLFHQNGPIDFYSIGDSDTGYYLQKNPLGEVWVGVFDGFCYPNLTAVERIANQTVIDFRYIPKFGWTYINTPRPYENDNPGEISRIFSSTIYAVGREHALQTSTSQGTQRISLPIHPSTSRISRNHLLFQAAKEYLIIQDTSRNGTTIQEAK